ncbi:pleckstrin homology domain-containing family A member 6 isoform X4 [Rhinichthys klamathensis goyatoka]|uniref:pleckstrin homology domain-containing family A member 6 isoform X4 n=1 Tax=Rhinichthys klamathensis goyatoka TaxID=3034132 RepID=UPI0024B59770|nr:pleckstrin homology domain-containing family A member 6 isoform X4 [Rhinichthys klamathensis goyatoka]XP_056125816.1 pleckstrin homology domain-containing family A member 6 isoform X4 [Rhinichthys klamathensis goyatoka]
MKEDTQEEGVESQNDPNGTVGHQQVIQTHLEENGPLKPLLSSDSEMNGKAGGRGPVNKASEANCNANNISMVSEMPPDSQNHTRGTRTPKRTATFGKRSNSMRRNPNAEVARQGWLHKQASSGVKQWNKRWFVLTDRCLFYYKDDKEEGVLGSLPLLSFKIGPVQALDNITRKFAFKVWRETEEEEEEEEGSEDLKGSIAFCLQVEHAGTRTYYFSADSQKEQEEWIQVMSEAARVHILATSRNKSEPIPTADQNDMVAKRLDPNSHAENNGQRPDFHEPVKHEPNGVESRDTTPSTPVTPNIEGRMGEKGGLVPHHPNGWGNYGPPNGSRYQSQENVRDLREPHEENVVLRRGFVPRTAPERLAQRKSSMTQLQQWVNQRRAMVPQDDGRSPSRYYTVNRGMPADCYGVYGGPPFMDEYPLYPPGVRPESICSMSAAYNRPSPRWTVEERRRSLRDGPVYGQPRDPQWMMGPQGPAYYPQLDSAQNSMRRLSIQPRSRSVPRSPSSSSGGPYSPHSFASPARSPSARFDRGPSRIREEGIYADPSVYGLRRSLSSPKYDFPGDRRSYSQGMYHYNYPASPASLHSKMEDILDVQLQRNLEYLDQQMTDGDHLIGMVTRMVERSSPRTKLFSQVPQFHDVYGDLHPTLKLNEIETSKLLGRLCEQNRLVKEQETVVHRLRMEKDSLEGVLVATHQEMELYRNQPLAMEKLQLKKESLQNKLINIRGELSQASSALTTTRMEFEALEDDVNSIHGDLWEQLNAGGQSELVHRHIQKEFWRVQDVLEGLHKNNPSRGTDTAKHRAASGASGSFSTNSPASPLSSVSLTSPLSPFSPVPGSHASPTKQLATEEVGPPRPPLPKSYQPLESSQSFPPSVPPLPLDSNAWLRSMGPHSGIQQEGYKNEEEFRSRKHNYNSQGEKTCDFETEQDRLSNQNKVGIVPPRTKSPSEEKNNSDAVQRRNGKVSNGHISRERPKSAVFPAEVKSKMSVEEQNERIRRNQSSSVRDKRRSLNLSSNQHIDGFRTSTNYRVVRRRVTADEVDIKDLEAAVRGGGVESPRQEIARLRRHVEPEHYDLDLNKELSMPNKVLIPERYLDIEPSTPLSPEEQREKQKKVERIKTLIAKSNLQNVVPVLDGPVEGSSNPEQQLHEQEKRIEISCALAAEASRRSRLLSAQALAAVKFDGEPF